MDRKKINTAVYNNCTATAFCNQKITLNNYFKCKNLLSSLPFFRGPPMSPSWSVSLYDVIRPVCSDDVMAADNFQMCERDFFHYTQWTLGPNG